MAPLTAEQLFAIEISTRASSTASLLGSLFIIATFLCFPYFRKPITRLVFFATWGNVVTNGATLISVSGMRDGTTTTPTTMTTTKTTTSPLCEAQAFLIQWCMLADPFWVFCMALNVWLVFVRGYDARKLKYLEKWYCMFAYGSPAGTAIVYLIHDHNSTRRIMGPAILWCWVRKEFDWMRIVFYYAPVWILAGTTMSIYICVGARIHRQQATLKAFARRSRQSTAASCSGVTQEDPFFTPNDQIVITTEIEHDVHEDETKSSTPPSSPTKPTASQFALASNTTRSSTPCSPSKSAGRCSLLVPLNPNSPHRNTHPLLISYRATAYAAPLATGEFATLPSPRVPVFQPLEHAAHTKRRKENAAAFAYFKVAFLMFVALVVVWVPSSINRLYQVAHPEHPSYGLNLVSAIVLPMQGLWNAAIYASSCWPDCRRAYAMVVSRIRGDALSRQPSSEMSRSESITYSGGAHKKVEVLHDGRAEGIRDPNLQ